ncbi:MAG TPA: YkgJ family cysteine cluster protein [Kofleriaceae bacterium]|nr:YkgJ family cysteine cluster protein [Kofleriaceae bacterium]
MRSISHRYRDPLDEIWLATAGRVGLRVQRSGDVYASTDGRRTLQLGEAASLDADDCLAQMIFHELCHSLVEGPDAFSRPDWGLDNTSARDEAREHACLRVQAHLADRHGLRGVLAPTTDYRTFYDRLPADPLAPHRHPEVVAARLGIRRADRPPWAPHLAAALAATAEVVASAARFAGPDSLHAAVVAPPAAHPTGLPPSPLAAAERRTCGQCAWRDEAGLCRQTEEPRAVAADWPACARWEGALDCQECGACCRAAYDSVTIDRDDPAVELLAELVVDRGAYLEIRRAGDRCAALGGGEGDEPFACAVYGERPRPCREFERGGDNCLIARRRVGLSL